MASVCFLGEALLLAFIASLGCTDAQSVTRVTLHKRLLPRRVQVPSSLSLEEAHSKTTVYEHLRRQRFAPLELHADAQMIEALRQQVVNVGDQIYTTSVEIGTSRHPVELIIDTGSSDMWIKRDAYHLARVSRDSKTVLTYGQGMLEGYQIKDTVCLDSLCIEEQPFVLTSDIRGIPDGSFYDGLIGLGPPGLQMERFGAPFLVNFANKFPARSAFALNLNGMEGNSYMAFGSVSALEADARESGAGFGHDLELQLSGGQEMFWMVSGHVSLSSQPLFVLDSASSLLMIPESEYFSVMEKLLIREHAHHCHLVGGLKFCSCDVQLRPVVFKFPTMQDDVLRIELTREDILLAAGDTGWCRVNIGNAGGLPFWVLGDVFLRRTYVVHDLKQKRLILFPKQTSDPLKQTLVLSALQFGSSLRFYILALASAILLACLLLARTVRNVIRLYAHNSSPDCPFIKLEA